MKGWYVDIVELKTKTVEKTLGPYPSERLAAKADRGVHINLDHGRYYTSTRQGAK